MNDDLPDPQTNRVLSALDEALSETCWSKSPFLTLMGKKLKAIRDDFASKQEGALDLRETETPQLKAERLERQSLMTKVFVSLYASEGANLQSWERVLQNLPGQLISRAIYADEADAVAIIRSKANSLNDAYVSLYVNPHDIINQPVDKIVTDKLGRPLLALKDKAISLDNLEQFVHRTERYSFVNGRLIKTK